MADSRPILITGHKGQLGNDLFKYFSERYNVIGLDLPEHDICNYDVISSYIKEEEPSAVIHAAAYTDVDGCESNIELAMKVNSEGTRNIALACKELNTRMMYFSTDYVFNGEKDSPYIESDMPDPKTIYGKSKLSGERAVQELLSNYCIMRIAWVYGKIGKNFVKTMLTLGQKQLENNGEAIKVVNDQIGNPTWTENIVKQTEKLLFSNESGVFHATSEGKASWYEFATDIFSHSLPDVKIKPCSSEEFPRPANRPKNSQLENRRLNELSLNIMPNYRDSLYDFLDKYKGVVF